MTDIFIAKIQTEFQEQMEQWTVQSQAEISALQNQIQQLNSRWQQQQQYLANMFTNGPPVFSNTTYPIPTVPPNQSSLNSSLIQELPYSLNVQTQINKQHHLNMPPSCYDILMTDINTNFETYTQNIRPFLSGVLNHVHGIGHLDKTTLTGLLEQVIYHTIVFQANFEVNYNTLLKWSPSTLVNLVVNPYKRYELYLNFVV